MNEETKPGMSAESKPNEESKAMMNEAYIKNVFKLWCYDSNSLKHVGMNEIINFVNTKLNEANSENARLQSQTTALQQENQRLREANEWVSVEDRLPEIGVIVNFVLKHSKLDVYSGFRAKGGWYAFRLGEDAKQFIPNYYDQIKITHWKPLPEPTTKNK